MVNSSDVQVLESSKAIKLPDSTAAAKPRETLVVMLSATDLLVQGRKVADIDGVLASNEDLIPALLQELKYQADKSPVLTEEQEKVGRAVTIMGDHKTPYKLLKKVMSTCASADYRNMSLAVSKIAPVSSEAGEGEA
jgi:biopolymer transport protein ExbD